MEFKDLVQENPKTLLIAARRAELLALIKEMLNNPQPLTFPQLEGVTGTLKELSVDNSFPDDIKFIPSMTMGNFTLNKVRLRVQIELLDTEGDLIPINHVPLGTLLYLSEIINQINNPQND